MVAKEISGTFCSFDWDGSALTFDVGTGYRRSFPGLTEEEVVGTVVDAWLDAHPYGSFAVPAVRRAVAQAMGE